MTIVASPRRSNGLWPAIVAAVLWWGVAALEVRLTYASTVPSTFAQLALPTAVPGFTWVTPQPWPVLAPALSALAVGGLVLWFVRLLERSARRPGRAAALFVAWFASVGASVIVGVAIGLGVTIANWPPGRLWYLLDAFPAPVQAAALWGVVWGWVPALIATARWGEIVVDPVRVTDAATGAPVPSVPAVPSTSPGPAAPPALPAPASPAVRVTSGRGRGRSLLTVMAASAAVVLVALAVLGQASARLAPPTGEPSAAPVPTPPATPIPTAAAHAPAPDPNWCSPTQVELSLGAEDGAAGHRAMTLTATNRTGVECVLDGYPDLAFGDANDSLLAVHAVQGSSFGVQDPGPSAVRLGAGQSAMSVLGWDAQPNDPAHQVHLIAAAPYRGAVRTVLPAQVDLIAGADVGYTAWQPQPAR